MFTGVAYSIPTRQNTASLALIALGIAMLAIIGKGIYRYYKAKENGLEHIKDAFKICLLTGVLYIVLLFLLSVGQPVVRSTIFGVSVVGVYLYFLGDSFYQALESLSSFFIDLQKADSSSIEAILEVFGYQGWFCQSSSIFI
eukprot:UN01451